MDERRDAIAVQLSQGGRETLEYLRALSPSQWARRVTDEWTVKDLVAHLASAEPALVGNIRRILSGQMVANPEFDVSRWNQRQVEKRRDQDGEELVQAVALEREATLSFLNALEVSDLARSGWHPSLGELTLEGHFRQIARHQQEHLEQIRQALTSP